MFPSTHRPPTTSRRRTTRIAAIGIVSAFVASGLALGSAAGQAGAQGGAPRSEPPALQGDSHGMPDKDVRLAPSVKAAPHAKAPAGAKARWNKLGTPSTVTRADGKPLATGLPKDPEQAARAYVGRHKELFGSPDLELVAVNPIGDGAAVLLRQRFGALSAGVDGQIAVGVNDGEVFHVSSTLTKSAPSLGAKAAVSEQQALRAAARDAGVKSPELKRVELVAVPFPDGARSAYQIVFSEKGSETGDTDAKAFTSHVDAADGRVLVRTNLVDHAEDPRWKVFPSDPGASTGDERETWCFESRPGCDFVSGGDPATGEAWDIDHESGDPTNTSKGNAALTFENKASSNPFTVGTRSNDPRDDRRYFYPFTNQWLAERCDPATLSSEPEADVEAAISNLHAMHNRMHDWSYRLGFTETAFNMQVDNGDRGGLAGDPEQGNAQAGADFSFIRDNANQITFPDGIAPITNMYMWQPLAGGFYAPCVDGDFDMSVIGHEYTHAISGRMTAGPDDGWRGPQGGAMNESTSDLFAMEYQFEYGFRPTGDTPYITGGYVTGDKQAGIRNYDMSKSPLNYSDMAYDLVGMQVHANGGIWSATQFDVRREFLRRYPGRSVRIQRMCAEGERPLNRCPGNRRWAQLSFDALLLLADPEVSMVDHRDALLAADQMRFGGANQDRMWRAFARHGLGKDAASEGTADPDPTPSFATPRGFNAKLTLRGSGPAKNAKIRLYVGDYEARAVPIADTDPDTPLGATFEMTPGSYTFTAVAPGFGHKKFRKFVPGHMKVRMEPNHAASASGATAGGDGVDHDGLIDETEATNWQSIEGDPAEKQVTVDLAGDKAVKVRRVQVSAMLRPGEEGDPDNPNSPQNRFTALRQFEVHACNASSGADCSSDDAYKKVYTSPEDAFPSRAPRPRAPDINIRSFRIPKVKATHLRLTVVDSQCTGAPDFAGEQDDDPGNDTDCATAAAFADLVRAAEFQAFSR